jgi:hypothetical protein
MKKVQLLILGCLTYCVLCSDSCASQQTADTKDAQKQEQLQQEGAAQIGMPDIHNFQEKKMVKMLYELRDSPNLINYAYLWSEVSGKWVYFGQCVGYGIPYSTQFSNPEKDIYETTTASEHHNMPQAEPNGLFMPASSDGTWLMMINPNKPDDIRPVYIEPKIIVSPFKLQQ